MLRKIFFATFVLLFLSTNVAVAQVNYDIDANIEYKVLESGTTAVTHTITLKNNTTYEYAKTYVLKLSNIKPENIKAYESGNPIPFELSQDDYTQTLRLQFSEPLVGKEKERTFIVTYEENEIAQHNGEVWEISIPKITSKYNSGKVVLSIPNSFGKEAIITPYLFEKRGINERRIYEFDKTNIEKSGINAVFGKFQVYSIKLVYHLENTKDKKDTVSIAIPPDTSTQRVFYSDIEPSPVNINTDDDGNWIAHFELPAKNTQDVQINGYVQVFSNPVKIINPNLLTTIENLKEQEFWEVNDPKIKEIAKNLQTPEKIYNFVTQTLTYDYDRVKPDVTRLGALGALNSTNSAICTEFTDLFITLARAAGIPAREINGYAQSDNPRLQPLSLISDVLHSWPEYWNQDQQNWIPVDPTWGSTSHLDYFSKFDLKHIAFVIHGENSTLPLPAGSYKSDELSKDVFVEYSQLPVFSKKPIEITSDVKNNINPFKKSLEIQIRNNQSSAIYKLTPNISYSGNENTSETILTLPPFSSYSTVIDLPIGLLAINTPENVIVNVGGTKETIYLNKAVFSIQQLVIFFSLLIIILLYIGYKTKRFRVYISLNHLIKTIKSVKNSKKI